MVLAAGEIQAGLFAHEFPLTLEAGHRLEAAGPLFSYEQKGPQTLWAFPPLFSHAADPSVDMEEYDFAYPIVTRDRFGAEYRFQFFQILSFSGGENQSASRAHRFTLMPFYFQQRSTDRRLNYTAVVPFYGEIRGHLLRDRVKFVMLPLYVQSQKKDVVTDNYAFPLFHLRRGDGLRGWQFWPLAGHETKGVTTRTNTIDEVEKVPGHEKNFALWPLYLQQKTGAGTENPRKFQAVLPLFSYERSPERDSTTVPWPIFTYTEDRAKKYHEWGAPWPLVVFARGEGKTANRVWPLFSQAHNAHLRSDFYLWPLYKYNRFSAEGVERERTRILFFLYSDLVEKVPGSTNEFHRTDLWPLFTARRDQGGQERLQILSLFEPGLPNNKSIERDYSPLWSVWRREKNPRTGASSESVLWNLYRRDTAPARNKCSLLFGLVRYESTPEERRWRLFYLPSLKAMKAAPAHPE